jgi:hypothetical protein
MVVTRFKWGRGRKVALKVALSAAAAVGVMVGSALPASADTVVGAPFTWSGKTWCPTFRAGNGCDNVQQSGSQSDVPFYPSQVSESDDQSTISLNMNSDATESGAFNTQTYETFSAPATISEQLTLPCDANGNIENWPAFWLVTTGTWPQGGEIDIAEGLHGQVAWHYHYLNAAGVNSQWGAYPTGFSGCGTHTYEVIWNSSALTFIYDGVQVGQVTSAQIGVPIATGPMYLINDYAASSLYGGPTTGGVSMQVSNLNSYVLSNPPPTWWGGNGPRKH